MKKWLVVVLMVAMVSTLALTGCGKKDNNNANDEVKSNGKGKGFKIGMVTDIGGVHDKSFNQSSWEGLEQLKKETGADIKYLESKADTDYVPNINSFVKGGYNLTWGIGFLMGDQVKQAALDNPNAKLAIIDNTVDAPNVASVTFAENEGSFLVGVVAGLTTKTNKIGFVGGIEIPVIKRFELGFVAGVKAVNPDAEVKINYTGAFDKPDAGKTAAATLYNDGVDIIFHAAGSTGNGVFNEAIERNKSGKKVWVIGVDKDQSLEFGNDVTLTSMMKRVDQAVIKVSEDLMDGNFAGGKSVVLGLKDKAVGLPEKNPNVSKDILDKVDDYSKKIISGEITVPTAQ